MRRGLRRRQTEEGETPVGFHAARGHYLVPDHEGWAREQGIEQRGTDDGRDGFPPADHPGPDKTHSEILGYVTELASRCRAEVMGHLQDLMGAVHEVHDESGLRMQCEQAEQIALAAKGEYDQRAGQDQAMLRPALDEYRAQETAVGEFQRTHKLGSRLAEDSGRRAAMLILCAIALVECLVNATVLRDVTPGGLGGALGLTAIITAVNILLGGVLGGEAWRQTNARAKETRIGGWVWLGLLTAMLLPFNLLVAHTRDAMKALEHELRGGNPLETIREVGRAAWEHFTSAPLEIGSFEAAILLMAGVASCLIAGWKRYQGDDPYPGYGRISRRMSEARETYQREREDATGELAKHHEGILIRLDDLVHEARHLRNEYESVCEEGRKIREDYPLQLRRYQGYLREQVQGYRDANVKARDGAAVPGYFGEEVHLDPELMEPPEWSPPERPEVHALAEKVGQEKRGLQDHYAKVLQTGYPAR